MTELDEQLVDPIQWSDSFLAPPVLRRAASSLGGATLGRWTGLPAEMEQPRLSSHCVVLHLGGDKRIRREGEGATLHADVAAGSISIAPAGRAFSWRTEGPIDFVHLYISPRRLERAVVEIFDREPATVILADVLGQVDALMSAQILALMERIAHPQAGDGLYTDVLFQGVLAELLLKSSNLSSIAAPAPYALAPRKLRRVLDYVEAKLDGPVGLSDLATVSGLSRFHFSRAFQRATGSSPYAFVMERRVARAKQLLRSTALTMADIASQCGFNSASQFSTTFGRMVGCSPSRYREGG